MLDVDARRVRANGSKCSTPRARSVGRDPNTVWRTLGLYALCGEDERDLERRFARLQSDHRRCARRRRPRDVRKGRLVGTVDEVRAQVREWDALDVDTIILGVGAVPFQVTAPDDVELLLHACTTA